MNDRICRAARRNGFTVLHSAYDHPTGWHIVLRCITAFREEEVYAWNTEEAVEMIDRTRADWQRRGLQTKTTNEKATK